MNPSPATTTLSPPLLLPSYPLSSHPFLHTPSPLLTSPLSRRRDRGQSEPIASNYYPVTTAAFIRDIVNDRGGDGNSGDGSINGDNNDNGGNGDGSGGNGSDDGVQISVLTDRSQGCASLQVGIHTHTLLIHPRRQPIQYTLSIHPVHALSPPCNTPKDGVIECMVHRRLLADDYRGVGEPLNETGELPDST